LYTHLIRTFIVVDDDPINNILSRIVIEMVIPEADIQTYTDPETALLYIRETNSYTDAPDTVLFLDINMPTLTGWEFLDVFEEMEEKVKAKLRIYMLSSSVDPRDRERAVGNKNVQDYMEKPLTRENVVIATNTSWI
jgi:two-component system, chemotaxis family, chemotaxis protein CheY